MARTSTTQAWLPGVVDRAAATVSDCGRYRYTLSRGATSIDRVLWCGLNPSTADATQEDNTSRLFFNFAKRFGLNAYIAVNLFAFRATKPSVMWDAMAHGVNIVGPETDSHIVAAARAPRTSLIVVAWGAAHRKARHRGIDVYRLLRETRPDLDIMCLGTNSDGSPRHPLMLASETPLRPWGSAEAAAPKRGR